jgi:hypothetical protein
MSDQVEKSISQQGESTMSNTITTGAVHHIALTVSDLTAPTG